MDRKDFIDVNRIVIKFGTNILRDENGDEALDRIESFIDSVSELQKKGKEVILVTSGAVGLGKKRLGVEEVNTEGLKQACAAIGQSKLMALYEKFFDKHDIVIAQILLIEDDFSQRLKYLSLRNTLNKLLELRVVPIINQNDTVSTNEICEGLQVCFADNDKLSALVASELDADMLIILSDVEGLFNDNPKLNKKAKIIREVDEVTDEILNLGQDASEGGRGGMKTKLEAARVVTRSGGRVLIANGKIENVIDKIFNAEDVGTMFLPHRDMLSSKKRWIGYATNILGKVIVNNGARKAIVEQNFSLLPIGVLRVVNKFEKGDVISILDEQEFEIARGIVNYNSEDCDRIKGLHSEKIIDLLGYKNYDAIITKDNITVL